MQLPDTTIHEAILIKRSPARSYKITAVMVVVAVIAIGFLVNIKHKSEQVEAEAAAARLQAQQQRETTNLTMMKELVQSYQGESKNGQQVALVARVGAAIATKSDAKTSKLAIRFHLLAEPNLINLFAVSTGDIYLTTALLNRMQTEGQLAAVLAHGVAHAMAADMAELTPVAQEWMQPSWHYTEVQEAAADTLAVKLMSQAGYDPNAMIGMFTVLLKAYQTKADVAFFATHPNEQHRLNAIMSAIQTLYPQGIPAVLSK